MNSDEVTNRPIFVLDNSPSLLALYKAQLEELGERVETFRNGSAAMSAAQSLQPKLVILGAELEDTNCLKLLNSCRDKQVCSDTPIIVISSSESLDFREKCFQLGVADFIPRKASQDYLITQVKGVLERIAAQQLQKVLAATGVRVLVAEDSLPIQSLYRLLLGEMGAQAHLCNDGQEALDYLHTHPDSVDLLITDLEMPRLTGLQLLEAVRADLRYQTLPIIVVTRFDALETAVNLLRSGATDYIHKPFRPEELQARINTHLFNSRLLKQQQMLTQQLRDLNDSLEQRVKDRTAELNEANKEMILKLALVCDFKDEDTGNHIHRVRLYCEELARAAGIPEAELEHFGYSSMLHDVGKVGIPDRILKKPGPLTEDEWEIMRTHTTKGAELLGDREFFRVAREIAQSHHERVDGKGYPQGLEGEQIPLSARIAAVVDVFDALTSKRCYKDAWSTEDALQELNRMTEGHLDQSLVQKIEQLQLRGELDYIRQRYP